MLKVNVQEDVRPIIVKAKPNYVPDPTQRMKALSWQGPKQVALVEVPKPRVTEPADAIIRVTSTTICGSDLHFYNGVAPGMQKGDIVGHEFMGIVDEVGPAVRDFKVGDRVVVGFPISCGTCWFCQREEYTLCEYTNPSKEMEELYGARISGAFGYSHLTGGYPGGQAEFARVPFADMNMLHVPDNLPDEKVLFLSDIACTGFHGNELGKVTEGDVVAVWGCGPVGLMALAWAHYRKASKLIAIDCIPERLRVAKERFGAEIINFKEADVVHTIRQLVPERGPDVVIDCAGFRFPKSLSHTAEFTLGLETEALDVITEMIITCRKGGHGSLIGDYFGYGNHFPIGPLMEKSINLRGGQAYVQKYWKQILNLIERGEFDPSFVITHRFTLDQIVEAYRIFDSKEDGCIKVIIHPRPTEPTSAV